jgi:hypothetical protein
MISQRLLDLDPIPMQEPNRIPGLMTPATHSAGATEEAKKYNYAERFDREPFIVTSKEWVQSSNGIL